MVKTVAIQGTAASFHHEAAVQFLGKKIHVNSQGTFKEVFKALSESGIDNAVVAIENSLYGSINQVYDLMLSHKYWICGEVYLRINQCLAGLPGTKLRDIKEVYSHPVALAQCEAYLDKFLLAAKRFEHHDTAASAKDVSKWNQKSKAAIAGKSAAMLHGLEVLAEDIETNKANYTRFVVLCKKPIINEGANKTSLVLTTQADTKAGALYRALGAFADESINLTMLQSRPIIGKAWHYLFYIDIMARSDSPEFVRAKAKLDELGYKITILGSYPSGQQ